MYYIWYDIDDNCTVFLSVLVNVTLNTQPLTGVIDNSGIEFFYTSTPRQHDAGILTVGHAVVRFMVIPPNTESYSVVGECSEDCTRTVDNSSINLKLQQQGTYGS